MRRMIFAFLLLCVLNSTKAAAQLSLKASEDSSTKIFLVKPLPQNFYNKYTGFFCQKEFQLQRAIKLPVFIRLGSKEYVDYLEKKPNATKRN